MCFLWLVGNAARQPLEASGVEGVTFPSLPDCPCCSTPTMEDELSQFGMCSQCKVKASSRCCALRPRRPVLNEFEMLVLTFSVMVCF